MITKIYLISLIGTIVFIGLTILFNKEYYNSEKESKYKKIMYKLKWIFNILSIILGIVHYIINIYIYKTKYWGENIIALVLTLCMIILVPVAILEWFIESNLEDKKFKYFDSLRKVIRIASAVFSCIIAIICIGFWLIGMLNFCFDSKTMVQQDKQKLYKEYSTSIEITELATVPYVNSTGSRYYIRSSPSIAYYYDVITDSGNTITEILDGSEYYVEKDEDDKYINNPHIKVYSIIKRYTNIYGEEREDFVTYEYTICVPKNSIYYEKSK